MTSHQMRCGLALGRRHRAAKPAILAFGAGSALVLVLRLAGLIAPAAIPPALIATFP